MFGSLTTVILGLGSALVWGTGDFFGGLASKRNNVIKVVLVSQFIGGCFLLAFALLFREQFVTGWPLVFGAVAGMSGALALLAFYTGLSGGQMAVFAPLTAVITSIIPIIVSGITEGRPGNLQIVGFVVAVIAVWFLSSSGDSSGENSGENSSENTDHTEDISRIQSQQVSKNNSLNTIVLALISGIGFSTFFILIDRASEEAIFWPLVAARVASVLLFLTITRVRTGNFSLSVVGFGIIFIVGLFNAGGNALYALAATTGRLDIVSVLGSLFPISTIFLAWIVLKEKLIPIQWIGVVLAIIALIFIAL